MEDSRRSAAQPAAKPLGHLDRGAGPSSLDRVRFLGKLVAESATSFSTNEGYRFGAAFAYYATSSVFPLVLLAVTAVGYVVGDSDWAKGRLLGTIATPNSPVYAIVERTLSAMQSHPTARGVSAVIGVLTLLFSASGAFVELDAALNRIWGAGPPNDVGLLASIRRFAIERLTGFAIVFGLGLTLLASLASSSVLELVLESARLRSLVGSSLWAPVARGANLLLSTALLSGVFTAAFHFIPRNRPPARLVAGGALVTTVALTALKELFADYLSRVTAYSAYGVAGGFLALTAWIYASSQVLLFGAQLTRVYVGSLLPRSTRA